MVTASALIPGSTSTGLSSGGGVGRQKVSRDWNGWFRSKPAWKAS